LLWNKHHTRETKCRKAKDGKKAKSRTATKKSSKRGKEKSIEEN